MNIFRVDNDPEIAAQMMCNKHVVKMLTESCQLLCTAHRLLDGESYIEKVNNRRVRKWKLDDERERLIYKGIHLGPCCQWTIESSANYMWLYKHMVALVKEYTFRYDKICKAEQTGLVEMLATEPHNIKQGPETPFRIVMPDIYKCDDVVESYRNYYRGAKKHILVWKRRTPPDWIQDTINNI
jgi:hypothetical protein